MFTSDGYNLQTLPSHPTMAAKLLLTVPEAAKVLGISRSVFYELLLAGDIRSVKIGRARRVPFAVLEDFVSHRLAETHQEIEKRVG